MSSGFVGRRVELALLDSVCSKANADNRPAAALISGVPGSGKSRLLAELRSRRRATHVLGVVGYESAFQVPLGAAANLLRGLGKVSDAGETLREFLFSPNPVDDRALEPLRLFEAARRALLGLEGSILLVADDLRWGDELWLAMYSYVIRSAAEEEIPFAVIAATRPTSRGLAFSDSLIKDLGEDRVWTIELGPLEPDEGAQLIRQLGPQLSAQRVAELWTRSKGSPFWLGFLARSGEEHDLGGYIATSQRGLGRDAARILALLSVATRPMQAPELEAVLEWDHARTERAIADLERSGLAVVQGVAVGLAHDLIRASAMAQLSAPSRRELHALLATFLERHAVADVQRLHEALVHRREAGLDANELALRVLQSPRRRLLGRDGLQELARIADASGLSEPLATALRLAVAQLASELGEQQIALDRWTALASSISDPTLRATAFLAASRAASQIIDRKDEAFPLIDMAANEASDDPVLGVEIESHRGRLLQVVKHRGQEGRAATFRAADRARKLWGNPPVEITARERNAYIAALQGAFDSSMVEEDGASQLRIAEEMAQVAGGSEEGAIWAAHNSAAALMFAGRGGAALDSGRRGWIQARERMLPMLILSAGPTLVSKLLDVGRLDEAEEVISECLELERRIAGSAERLAIGKVGIFSIHDLRHQIWLSRGDWRDAVASLERELLLQPDPHHRIALHWHVLVWLARCGDRTQGAQVDRHAVAGRQDALNGGCRRCARQLALRAAEGYAPLGRIDDAGNR